MIQLLRAPVPLCILSMILFWIMYVGRWVGEYSARWNVVNKRWCLMEKCTNYNLILFIRFFVVVVVILFLYVCNKSRVNEAHSKVIVSKRSTYICRLHTLCSCYSDFIFLHWNLRILITKLTAFVSNKNLFTLSICTWNAANRANISSIFKPS